MKSAYGIDIQSENDEYVRIAEKGLEILTTSVGQGIPLIDILPIRMSISRALCVCCTLMTDYSQTPSCVVPWHGYQETSKRMEAMC